jgi:hypothetical protein
MSKRRIYSPRVDTVLSEGGLIVVGHEIGEEVAGRREPGVSAQVAGRLSALEELAAIMDRGKAEERLLKLERAKRWRRLPAPFAYWRCPCFDCEVY